MPWKEVKPMDQKITMISSLLKKEYSVTYLAEAYGVSRKTIYKWMDRYKKEGIEGLKNKSSKPHYHPNTTKDEIVTKIVAKKVKYKKWGPKKIIVKLQEEYPDVEWPAPSTAGEWLKKNNLVCPRKIRTRVPPYNDPFIACKTANDVWSADYKGEFRTKDGIRCYPLTVSDNFSRYILACKGLPGPRYVETKEEFEKIFKKNGLPYAIRVDNGNPFTGRNRTGLSKLSIWWIKLGIIPERIAKAQPTQNGRHERMHRTLKEYAISPAGHDMCDQQKKFDRFIYEYNEERPHEALGQKTPSSKYETSKREYREQPHKIEYDLGYEVRRVRSSGEIKFDGGCFYLTELLSGEQVGLKQISDGIWKIYFSFQAICVLNLLKKKIESIAKYKKVLPLYPV